MRISIKDIFIILLTAFLLLIITTEIYLRYFSILSSPIVSGEKTPTAVCRPDPQLGWLNKPGIHTALTSSSESSPVTVTIANDGSRLTTTQDTETDNLRDSIVLVGGSVMFGEGLSDEQVLGWKMEQTLPGMRIMNYAVKGYGTYQSLLMLEKVLPGVPDTTFVVYGCIDHHIDRNVAPAYWRALCNLRSESEIAVPYVTLDEDRTIRRHYPELFSPWPLSDFMLTFRVLEMFIKRKTFLESNNTEKHTVMQLLLLEMRDLCKANGCELIVAMFIMRPEAEDLYTRFCRINSIPVINFDLDSIKHKHPLIPGEGHPNETVNTLWAEQTADFITALISDKKEGGTKNRIN